MCSSGENEKMTRKEDHILDRHNMSLKEFDTSMVYSIEQDKNFLPYPLSSVLPGMSDLTA